MNPNPPNARAGQLKLGGCLMAAILAALVFGNPPLASAADARSGSQSMNTSRADQTQTAHHRARVDGRRSRIALSSTPTVLRGTRAPAAPALQPSIPIVMRPTGPGVALGAGYGSTVNPVGGVPEGGWGGLDFSGLNPPARGAIMGR